ncbi:hypothetical protein B1H36_05715 [Enterococcus faecium]|nr:hypothetical protein B1H36_05715 [Enterococcus faecium]
MSVNAKGEKSFFDKCADLVESQGSFNRLLCINSYFLQYYTLKSKSCFGKKVFCKNGQVG